MNSNINLNEILMTSVLGLMLASIILLTTVLKSNNKSREIYFIRLLLISTIVVQIVNPISYLVDGHPQMVYRLLLWISDLIIYSANIVIGLLWMAMVTTHLNIRMSRWNKLLVYSICTIAVILLIVNMFIPIVYGVDANNVYHRGPLASLYIEIEMFFAVDGIIMYIITKRRGGILKSFPVWQFALPVVIGAIVQQSVYGVSITVPCVAISILGLVMGLQNDREYSDETTGVYNRFYLDYIKSKLGSKSNSIFTVMMMNLNNFDAINESESYSEGDRVLRDVAGILNSLVGSRGSVIRYAGDEFIVILNSERPDEGAYLALNINRSIMDYNADFDGRYNLSMSIGNCIVDLRETSVDNVMNMVDDKMRQNRERYHR